MLRSDGFASLLILLILAIGVGVGIFLVSRGTNFLPKAFEANSTPVLALTENNPQKILTDPNSSVIEALPEQNFVVNLNLNTKADRMGSFVANITFPKDLLSLEKINASALASLPVIWRTQTFDNSVGTITLAGDFPDNGYKTADDGGLLARLEFFVRPNTAGQIAKIEFLEDSTKLIKKATSDEVNPLIKKSIEVRIKLSATPIN